MTSSKKLSRFLFLPAVFLAAHVGRVAPAHAGSGDLDAGFGQGGVVISDVSHESDDRGSAMALQDDGKIVVAGTSKKVPPKISIQRQQIAVKSPWLSSRVTRSTRGASSLPEQIVATADVALIRYNADGSLDTTFGSDGTGKVFTDVGHDSVESVAGVFVLKTGKILVVGTAGTQSSSELIVLRYLANGGLDTDFGPNDSGKVGVVFDTFNRAYKAARMDDGKFLVVGGVSNGSEEKMALIRLNADGSPDEAFGTNGLAQDPGLSSPGHAFSLALQMDGKVVIGGLLIDAADRTPFLARYLPNGTLDSDFGTNGSVSFTLPLIKGGVLALGLQKNGGIVSAIGLFGSSQAFYLVRHTGDGVRDTSFGVGGVSEFSGLHSLTDVPYALRLDPDGKILVAGTVKINVGNANQNPNVAQPLMDEGFSLVRYTANGLLDREGFGDNHDGIAQASGLDGRGPRALVLQEDGKILVGGTAKGSGNDFAVMRYLP